MNILFLSPFFPYPLDQGGKIRIFNTIKYLSRSHTITLVAIVDNCEITNRAPLHAFCDEVVLVERPAKVWPDRLAFFSGRAPYNEIRYRSAEMRSILSRLALSKKFDLVQIEFSMMWQYANLFRTIPVILDAHNIEHKNIKEIGQAKRGLFWSMMYQIEEKRLRRVEERGWQQCALCFAVSEQERDEIADRTGESSKVITAANGVDLKRFTFQPRLSGGTKILFLGGMDYYPNLDAAMFFLSEVFPLIRYQEPEATVLLVGRELSRLGDKVTQPGVECHESVPEVLPWFYEANLLAVPLRQGAGTRIKVLEAMAAGLPVVATSKGCEGISAKHGQELLIADSPAQFASAALSVMHGGATGAALAYRARRLVEEQYTWEHATKTMEDAYKASI